MSDFAFFSNLPGTGEKLTIAVRSVREHSSRCRRLDFAQPALEKSTFALVSHERERERRSRAVHHRDRHRTVQRHDGRRQHSFQKIVEPGNLRPVGIFGPRRLTVRGRNCRLHREWTGRAAKCLLYKWQCLGDLSPVPAAAILFFQNDNIAFIPTLRVENE